MNIERIANERAEISALLFYTYKSEIKFTSDTAFSVSFTKNSTIDLNNLSEPGKMKLPFWCWSLWAHINIFNPQWKDYKPESLHAIRSNSVENYFANGHDKTYPNMLFNFQKQVKEVYDMEAYNHWILMKGDEESFDSLQSTNRR